MNKQKLYRYSRKIHKWVGLFIAIQVLFWIVGGLIMSSIPLEKVHGKHLHKNSDKQQVVMTEYKVSLESILEKNSHNPTSVKFYFVNDTPVYEVEDKDKYYYSGITGDHLELLSQKEVEQFAKVYFTGNEPIKSSKLIKSIPLEASKLKDPVWQLYFDDSIDTTFYIHPYNGQLLTVRSDIWRLFDFVWMLHIMDYDTRDDFNNPLLITFAASALIFTISGIILLFQVFRRRNVNR
ncbi:MAG: PepSY domain-containing protein [Gammaproteobacteria bacterium]|nr:PepSY domain-containing protein [Gammaproteobacteria bacterium]